MDSAQPKIVLLTGYYGGSRIEEPSTEQVVNAIRALDNESRTTVTLWHDNDRMIVQGGLEDKVAVDVDRNNAHLWARLVNPHAPSDREEFLIMANANTEIDYPLRRIVSKEMAIQAAIYFFYTRELDSSMQWDVWEG